jgi:antitoxin MazE
MTQVIIKKWGNSLSVRLPSAIVKAASLNVDDVVELSVEDGAITIVPVKTKEYSLDALMAGVTNENIHEEISSALLLGRSCCNEKEDRSFIIWGSLSYRGGVLRCNGSVRLRVVAAVSSLAVNTPDKTRVSPFGSQSQGR